MKYPTLITVISCKVADQKKVESCAYKWRNDGRPPYWSLLAITSYMYSCLGNVTTAHLLGEISINWGAHKHRSWRKLNVDVSSTKRENQLPNVNQIYHKQETPLVRELFYNKSNIHEDLIRIEYERRVLFSVQMSTLHHLFTPSMVLIPLPSAAIWANWHDMDGPSAFRN